MSKSGDINMLSGSVWDKLIIFAVPLALTGVLQQLFNAADVAVLGQFVGKNAMAAVGNNISLIGLLVNLFLGLSLGANVIIAQNIGGRRLDNVKSAVHTAFLLALYVGMAVTVFGESMTEWVLNMMEVPASVREMAETYFRIYLLGMPVIGLYNFEAAIFRSRGDTKTPLISLVVASLLNIALNLLFVLKFNLGVAGVAWATVIASGVSAFILLRILMHTDSVIKIELSAIKINRDRLREIVRIGLPAGIQGMVFSLSNLLIQAAINSLGADAMAASAAAFTIEINVYCVVSAFAQATTTFVGQNYGAKKLLRCRRITRVAMGLNCIFMGVLSVFILLFAEEMLSFFNPDPNVVELGKIRLWYVVSPEIICVLLEGFSGAMRGYGISLPPAIIALVGICSIRIGWLYTVFPASPDYATLMLVYPVSWLITTIFTGIAYFYAIKHLS